MTLMGKVLEVRCRVGEPVVSWGEPCAIASAVFALSQILTQSVRGSIGHDLCHDCANYTHWAWA